MPRSTNVDGLIQLRRRWRPSGPATATALLVHGMGEHSGRYEHVGTRLAERGIDTKIHYPIPIHLQPASRALGHAPGSFPVTEAQAARILSLPVHAELTRQQLEWVVEAVSEVHG